MGKPLIAVVGVCASGKSTLVAGLKALGIEAISVPQEHSSVRALWERKNPDLLVVLDARWETTKRRRPEISYGPERLEDQRQRLQVARERCHLYLPTDDLSVEAVREAVQALAERWKEQVHDTAH